MRSIRTPYSVLVTWILAGWLGPDGSDILVVGAFAPSSSSSSRLGRALPTGSANIYRRGLVDRGPLSSDMALCSTPSGYVPPEQSNAASASSTAATKKKPLLPQPGDIVRYYDLDGGDARGQVLVGRIGFISSQISNSNKNAPPQWTAEVTELEDMGDGYYAEYGSTKRQWKRSTRNLAQLAPIAASFVRSESAYKMPLARDSGLPVVRAETYDLDEYKGPVAAAKPVNAEVVEADALVYQQLKGRLFRYAALAGLAGTLVADLAQGTDFAVIYGAGFVASLAYLFLLSLKTDTIAAAGNSEAARFAQRLSNLRFVTPILVFLGVALYNQSLGEANPASGDKLFAWITSRQFTAAAAGFLTYRLPLFVVQIQAAFESDQKDGDTTEGGVGGTGVTLPGSAGLALQMMADDSPLATEALPTTGEEDVATVFLISGPQATGRSELVDQLVATDNRVVRPNFFVDKVTDAATFERLEQRNELLSVVDGRYGLTKEKLIASAQQASEQNQVLVVDASVALAQELVKVSGLRIVGVWVGLESVPDFEQRLAADIASGNIAIPEDETPESVIRARIKQIVKEIEYGLGSGIFEFTVLNRNVEESVQQLKDACAYCFK